MGKSGSSITPANGVSIPNSDCLVLSWKESMSQVVNKLAVHMHTNQKWCEGRGDVIMVNSI